MPQITNQVFAEIFDHLTDLRSVDLCDCEGLYVTAMNLLLRRNKNLELIQLSGCNNGVDDQAMEVIATMKNLEFLDISYCTQVTDAGLEYFK